MSGAPAHASPRLRLRAPDLKRIGTAMLRAAGADDESSRVVAASLVGSDLRGVSSHGVIRLPEYLRAIAEGRILPAARPEVRVDSGPVFALDGRGCFGAVAARELAVAAAERAAAHGACVATLAGVSHVGRVGEWVELVADAGSVALAWCNCGDPGGNVAPFGGRTSKLGTNPIAYAIPVAGRAPVVADFSTSIVAEGRVRLHLHERGEVPAGWLLDAGGAPTRDPRDLYAGGAILPMGGHKGFALGLLVEILGGVLAGGGCASLGEQAGNGLVLVAIDPGAFGSREAFAERVAAVFDSVAATPAAHGSAGVTLPGAPEAASIERHERTGIPLRGETWDTLVRAAETVGVDLRSEPTIEGGGDVV